MNDFQVLEEPLVELTLHLNDPDKTETQTVTFSLTSRKFQTFLHGKISAVSIMVCVQGWGC